MSEQSSSTPVSNAEVYINHLIDQSKACRLPSTLELQFRHNGFVAIDTGDHVIGYNLPLTGIVHLDSTVEIPRGRYALSVLDSPRVQFIKDEQRVIGLSQRSFVVLSKHNSLKKFAFFNFEQ